MMQRAASTCAIAAQWSRYAICCVQGCSQRVGRFIAHVDADCSRWSARRSRHIASDSHWHWRLLQVKRRAEATRRIEPGERMAQSDSTSATHAASARTNWTMMFASWRPRWH